MTSCHTNSRGNATVNALAIALFSMMLVLAYFVTCIATMLFTVVEWSLSTTAAMLLCAAVPTSWTAYRIHRELRRQDKAAASSGLLARQLWVFITALRVPLLIGAGGVLAQNDGLDPACLWIVAVPVAIWGPAVIRWWLKSRSYPTDILRGTRLLSGTELSRATVTARQLGGDILDWCGIGLPDALASGHMAIIGATASGKTVSMRLLMQSILPYIRPGSGRRAILYDAKQDLLGIIGGMRLCVPVILLNPFDYRSSGWAIAEDVKTLATALQVAYILITEEQGGNNAFFVKAARDLLAAVFIALHITKPGRWTLADAILILSDSTRAKTLLTSLPQTAHIAREYFSRDPRVLSSVQSTISANVAMLRPIAAMWSKSAHKISLTKWVNSESILVLGNDEQLRAPMDAINRVIFQRITELILAQSESSHRRSWFFLDEIKEASKLESLPRLLTKGRSKGARVVLAFQAIEGLRAVYGEHLADELAGMCATKAFLRTDSPVTAKWAASIIGEHQVREWTQSVQRGYNNSSTSQAAHIVRREAILASEIMQLPPARAGRFEGFFVTPGIGIYKRTVSFADRLLPLGKVPNFIPRPPEDQYLYDLPAEPEDPRRNPLDDIGRVSDADLNDFQADEDERVDFDNPANT